MSPGLESEWNYEGQYSADELTIFPGDNSHLFSELNGWLGWKLPLWTDKLAALPAKIGPAFPRPFATPGKFKIPRSVWGS
jgi:hypothetical protein